MKNIGEIPINLLINFKGTRAIPLAEKSTILLKGYIHLNSADQLPGAYYAILGGRGNNYKQPGVHGFHGYKIAEFAAPNALLGSFVFQQEIFKENYLQLHLDGANLQDKRRDLLTFQDWQWGAALTYGYNSFIGPIEVTGSYNGQQDFLFYLNIGFWI